MYNLQLAICIIIELRDCGLFLDLSHSSAAIIAARIYACPSNRFFAHFWCRRRSFQFASDWLIVCEKTALLYFHFLK